MMVIVSFIRFPYLKLLLDLFSKIENTYYTPGTAANGLYSISFMKTFGLGMLQCFIFELKYKDEFVKLLAGTKICLSHKNMIYCTPNDLQNHQNFKIKERLQNELGIQITKEFWIEEGEQNERKDGYNKVCLKTDDLEYDMQEISIMKTNIEKNRKEMEEDGMIMYTSVI